MGGSPYSPDFNRITSEFPTPVASRSLHGILTGSHGLTGLLLRKHFAAYPASCSEGVLSHAEVVLMGDSLLHVFNTFHLSRAYSQSLSTRAAR